MLLREIISEKPLATPAGTEFDVRNTLFFNILCANPLLARFYADFFRRHGANSSIIKDLETRSANFFSPDQSTGNSTTQTSERLKLHGSQSKHSCLHSHQGQRNPLRLSIAAPGSLLLFPSAHDPWRAHSAQIAPPSHRQLRGPAGLLLRALSIAARNASKTRFDCWQSDMVKEVPEYPAAPPVASPFAIAAVQAAALISINTPPEEESEADRLSAFHPASADVRRKPPASVKTAPRAHSANSGRAR